MMSNLPPYFHKPKARIFIIIYPKNILYITSKTLQYFPIGFVNLIRLYRVQIYLGGCFRLMSESFADYRERNVLSACYRCPAVATVIKRQRHRQMSHVCHLFKVPVYLHHLVLVLPSLASVLTFYYGQQIFGFVGLILVKYFLHLPCPFNDEQLPGLLSPVSEITVAQVFLLEISHIHERHSAGAEAEDKHVAGILPDRFPRQVQLLYLFDIAKRDAPLHGLVHSAIDMPEGTAVVSESPLHRHFIVGAQYTHVERRGVARKATAQHLGFIKFEQL